MPSPSVTRVSTPTARIALATCAELPDLDPDDLPLVAALAERGVSAEPVVWDDPTVDWGTYPAVLLRSTWDYSDRPQQFAEWIRRVDRTSTLLNPAAAVTWNIDKTYLRALEGAGLPIVPTIWLDPERQMDSRAIHTRFPAFGDFVIKPTVSAGSRDTGRYVAGETQSRSLAIMHAKNLLGVGRWVMLQRYLAGVDTVGETAVVFIDGQLSHSVRKTPALAGPYRKGESDEGPFHREGVQADATASEAELSLAQRVVDALPGLVPGVDHPLLYARVDMVPDDQGRPVVLELEVIEPSLFFAHGPGAVEAFADALVARLRPSGA
ncbi:ATP-grasp domain-containing protein [Cellulomonas marina]|nr:ATP-grasp domain-containing protein [Cellulomonas marina]